jgi:hypothetical protein
MHNGSTIEKKKKKTKRHCFHVSASVVLSLLSGEAGNTLWGSEAVLLLGNGIYHKFFAPSPTAYKRAPR